MKYVFLLAMLAAPASAIWLGILGLYTVAAFWPEGGNHGRS